MMAAAVWAVIKRALVRAECIKRCADTCNSFDKVLHFGPSDAGRENLPGLAVSVPECLGILVFWNRNKKAEQRPHPASGRPKYTNLI